MIGSTVRRTLNARLAVAAALILVAQVVIDGGVPGAVVGGFALAWLGSLLVVRPAILRARGARIAAIVAGGFALVMVDAPSLLGWVLFWIALSLATLLPRRRFDDAASWALRLAWHALAALPAPLKHLARAALVRDRRGTPTRGVRAAAATLALPIGGGVVFALLFADANPLIGNAFAQVTLPDGWTIAWRAMLAILVLIPVWASLRPSARATAMPQIAAQPGIAAPDLGLATLTLSLVTFNAIFAIQNALDVAFLWSGAALPAGVTMADYAHRGAYALIVTALLAGAFVLVALRPGSNGACSPIVRRLVTAWIAQNLLLVASSILRTLDYVDAYGLTVLRVSALLWMMLVATGLALIGWRLLRVRSAAWLVNANALATALVLAIASVVDLGATAAAWNARVALDRGRAGPPLDLCYLARLGPSALVSLARLEGHARQPALRDSLAAIRWSIQSNLIAAQADWRSWTPRGARRLATTAALVGADAPSLRPAPDGRTCSGRIVPPPPPPPAPLPAPAPTPLTPAPQR